MEDTIVKELNEFLEGNFMAIHAYEKFIHHIDDPICKDKLQEIQKEHKIHAMQIAERIQDLGGIPADDAGFRGSVAEFMADLTQSTEGTHHILKDALAGEERGIKVSRELVKGDLDPESLELVKSILRRDEKHVEELNGMIH
jgi:bacterioferritin